MSKNLNISVLVAARDEYIEQLKSIMCPLIIQGVNSIYQDRLDLLNKSDKVRTASKKIKSSAHEGFLMSLRPVTGRASLGPLADEYDGLFGVIDTPFVGGSLSYPLNNYAINELQSYASNQNDSVRKVVAKKLENINIIKHESTSKAK